MNKQEILSRYKKEEDRLILAKVLDKQVASTTKKQITHTDFLDMAEQKLVESFLQRQKIGHFSWQGGYVNAQRKQLYFYHEKSEEGKEIEISVLRVKLPKEKIGEYEHRIYLGGILKLGVKREKIGDILVEEDGADILIDKEILPFLREHLGDLTRFQKANLEEVELQDIRRIEQKKEEKNIIVPSMRLDAIVSEIVECSRAKAEEYLKQERVFLNYEMTTKGTKEVKENSILTIRGKGKYDIVEIVGLSKKQKIIVKIAKWV